MTYEIDSIDYKDCRISIITDDSPENPREWSNLGKMICFHKRYNLGDYKLVDNQKPDKFLYYLILDLSKTNKEVDEINNNYDNLGFNEFIEYALNKLEKNAIVLPLYLYDHSGITMNTTGFSCPWDSGKVGFIYATFEDIKKEYNIKKLTKKVLEKARQLLISEVKDYDVYLTGDICAFQIYDEDENEVESCYGFYDRNECINEAKSSIDWSSKNKQKRLEKESLIMTA